MKLQSITKKAQSAPITEYGQHYGLYSRVARLLGVSPSHVRKVNLRLHKSKRVADALLAERERIRSEAGEPRPRKKRMSGKVA